MRYYVYNALYSKVFESFVLAQAADLPILGVY